MIAFRKKSLGNCYQNTVNIQYFKTFIKKLKFKMIFIQIFYINLVQLPPLIIKLPHCGAWAPR